MVSTPVETPKFIIARILLVVNPLRALRRFIFLNEIQSLSHRGAEEGKYVKGPPEFVTVYSLFSRRKLTVFSCLTISVEDFDARTR